MSSYEEEALRLLEAARRLGPRERKVFEYFRKYVSVGDLRAVLDLERLGVRDAQDVIDRLVEMGLLERGVDCYNLARPLREYFRRKR